DYFEGPFFWHERLVAFRHFDLSTGYRGGLRNHLPMIPSLPTVAPLRNVLLAVSAILLFGHRVTHAGETRQVTLQDFLSKRGYEVMPLTRARDNCLFIDGKVNGR